MITNSTKLCQHSRKLPPSNSYCTVEYSTADEKGHRLSLNEVELCRVFSVRFLGVILDPNLAWDDHIKNVTRKLTKYVPILYRIRNLCTKKSLMLIYNCLIYSNLIYCNSVWGFCKNSALYPLVVKQKKIVRAIAGVSRLHHTESIFDEFRLLKLESINNLHNLPVWLYPSIP